MTIILYDLASNFPGTTWSPNTWKARLCLNYKGLPYKTEWLELPEIAPHSIKHGISASSVKLDGTPHYTLPAIHDPSTGSYISDSFAIAVYLDATYPSAPLIFPHGTQGLQASFESAFAPEVKGLLPIIYPIIMSNLNESSVNYLKAVNSKTAGEPIPNAEVVLAKTEQDLWKVHGWYENASRSRGDKGPFLLGEVVSWADFVVCAQFLCWRTVLGPDTKEWKYMEKWNAGKWGTLVENLGKYQGVH